MAALESYYFEPNVFQIPKMVAVENSDADNQSKKKKIHFADLVKDAKSAAGFSPSCQI